MRKRRVHSTWEKIKIKNKISNEKTDGSQDKKSSACSFWPFNKNSKWVIWLEALSSVSISSLYDRRVRHIRRRVGGYFTFHRIQKTSRPHSNSARHTLVFFFFLELQKTRQIRSFRRSFFKCLRAFGWNQTRESDKIYIISIQKTKKNQFSIYERDKRRDATQNIIRNVKRNCESHLILIHFWS